MLVDIFAVNLWNSSIFFYELNTKQPQYQFYFEVSLARLKTSDQHPNAHQLMYNQVHT